MASGRIGNSVRNIVYRLISQGATILLRFVSRTIFIYVLGVEYLGINGLFSEILQMLSLADLGFGTAMVFSMYKPLAEKDEYKLAQLVQLYKKVYMIIALAITVVGVALVPFLQYLVNLDQDIPYLKIYYLLYLANTVASYLVVYKTCILNADQKNYLVSKYNTIFNLLSTVGCAVFLLLTKNFMVYLIVQVVFTYANNFYVSHVAQKMYPYINSKVDKLSKTEEKSIFNNVKSVFIYKVANTLVGSTDNTLISILVGTVAVGYYSNYTMVVNNIQMIINIVFSSITASIGNLVVEKNAEKNYSVYKTMQFISYILSCVAITGVYIMINDLIKVWIGEKYVLSPLVVIAIVINMYFSVVLMPIWSYREATGMYMQTKYVMVMTAIVNLIVSIILGRSLGLAGILLATSIARLSTYFWYEPKLLFAQFFDRKVGSYYVGIIVNILITIAVMMINVFIFQRIKITTWGGFFIKTILVTAVTLVCTLILYGWNSEMKNVLGLLRKFVKR